MHVVWMSVVCVNCSATLLMSCPSILGDDEIEKFVKEIEAEAEEKANAKKKNGDKAEKK